MNRQSLDKILQQDEWVYLFVFCFNLILRLLYFTSHPVALDEPFSIYHAQFSVGEIIHTISQGNNPPLYELFLHFWIKLFGISPFSVRLPSVLFMSIAAVLLYRLAKLFFNRYAAVVVVSLFTFSNLLLYHSHEARAYSMTVLWSVCSLYFLLHLIHKKNNLHWHAIGLGVANALLLYTHYTGGFLIAAEAAYLLFLSLRGRRFFLYFLLSFFVLFFLCLPMLATLYARAGEVVAHGSWVQPCKWADGYNMLTLFNNKPMVAVISVIVLLLFLCLILSKKITLSQSIVAVIICCLLPYFVLLFLSVENSPFSIPLFMPRYLVFILPAYYLMLGVFWAELLDFFSMKKLLPLPILLAVFTFSARTDHHRQPKLAVEYIRANCVWNTAIVVCPDWFNHNFFYYYDLNFFKEKKIGNTPYQDMFFVKNADEISDGKLEKYNRIIYMNYTADFAYPGNNVGYYLTTHFLEISKKDFPDGMTVFIYQKK